jgi:hypothetical protein
MTVASAALLTTIRWLTTERPRSSRSSDQPIASATTVQPAVSSATDADVRGGDHAGSCGW